MMRTIIVALFFLPVISLFAQNPVIQEINILGTSLSDKYILRYLPFAVGDMIDAEDLSSQLEKARIKAQADSNIDVFEPDYFQDENGWIIDIFVSDPAFKLTFGNFNDPISAGTYIEYKNLLGEGWDLGGYAGFDKHMMQLSWNYILGSRIGIQTRAGHEFLNPMLSSARLSAIGATSRLYYLFGANSGKKIGLISDIYGITGKEKGMSFSLGAFFQDDSTYLLDRIGLGFKTMLRYRYFFHDRISGIHRIDAKERVSYRPFASDRFMAVLDASISYASDRLYSMTTMNFSHSADKAGWQIGLFLPVSPIKIRGSLNILIGLEPGISVGKTDSMLSLEQPEWAVSIAPFVQLGHPVSLVFTPRIGYNISTGSFGFTFVLRELPYTMELDEGW